jgi:hypothetical protein
MKTNLRNFSHSTGWENRAPATDHLVARREELSPVGVGALAVGQQQPKKQRLQFRLDREQIVANVHSLIWLTQERDISANHQILFSSKNTIAV